MRKQLCRKWTMAGYNSEPLPALLWFVFVYDATLSPLPFFEYIYIFSIFLCSSRRPEEGGEGGEPKLSKNALQKLAKRKKD
jgi:hypothetical protein